MRSIDTDKIFAFQDNEGTFVLDKNNVAPFRVETGLDDIEELEKVVDTKKREIIKPEALNYMRVQFCVTHLCNFGCSYCNLDGENKYGKDALMNIETAKKAVEKVLEYKPEHVEKILISLTSNGETLTNFDMVEELMDYCREITKDKDYRFTFNFATNAVMLDESLIEKILDHDELTIFFSLDGRKEVHNKLRTYRKNGEDTYDDVVEKIKLYHQMAKERGKENLASSSVITTHNLDIVDAYKHLIDMGFNYIVTRPVRGPREWGFALTDETLEDYKQAYQEFYVFLKNCIDDGNYEFLEKMAPVYDFFGRPFYMMLLNEKRDHGCPHCPPDTKDLKNYSITFDSNGDIVSPCRDLIGVEQFKVGNIEDGFDDEKLEAITQFHNGKREDCVNCWDRTVCGGGCHMVAYYNTGDVYKPDPIMCDLTKFTTKLAIKLVTYIQEHDPKLYLNLIEKGKKTVPWRSKYSH